MENRSPTQELSDLFYALSIHVKMIENLMLTRNERAYYDYFQRWRAFSDAFCSDLKKVKPAVERLLKEGEDKIGNKNIAYDQTFDIKKLLSDYKLPYLRKDENGNTLGLDSKGQVLIIESEGMADSEQLPDKEN
jgi:hypothetical protein